MFYGQVPDEVEEWEEKSGYGEASLSLRARMGDQGDGFADLRFMASEDAAGSDQDVNIHEAYVNVYAGQFDIRFGQQIVVWGRADGINPTNNITPYDYRVRSPEEDDRRMANLGLRAYFNVDKFRFESIWMPTYAESYFPEFNIAGPIILGESNYPGNKLQGGVGAFRINYGSPEIDWSVSYLNGQAIFPGVELRNITLLAPPAMPEIEVGFSSYQHQVIGADFSATLGKFGTRGEIAYKWPYHYRDHEYIPNPELYYVLGMDFDLANGDIFVIVQYVGKYVYDWDEIEETGLLEDGPSGPLTPDQFNALLLQEITLINRMLHGQQDEYSHAGMTRIQYTTLQDTLSLELLGMYNFTTYESVVRPMVTYDIADGLNMSAGAEIYQGPDGTLNGMIDESQSAVFFELKASF